MRRGIDERRRLGEADRERLDELAALYRRLRIGDEGQRGLLALGRDLITP